MQSQKLTVKHIPFQLSNVSISFKNTYNIFLIFFNLNQDTEFKDDNLLQRKSFSTN